MAQKTYSEKWSISVPRGHHETAERTSADGSRICKTRFWVREEPTLEHIEVYIDIERIARDLGVKAARSKSGKSIALGGAIKITHRRDR